jgi:hypothetical protein
MLQELNKERKKKLVCVVDPDPDLEPDPQNHQKKLAIC